MTGLAEAIGRALFRDHKCGLHNGPNSGPCRTCRRRTALVDAAVRDFLRAVAADEGVRERVANAVPLGWTERDPYRDVFEAADAALTAFLDHLDHGRAGDAGEGWAPAGATGAPGDEQALPRVRTPGAGVQRGTEAHSDSEEIQ